MNDIKLQTTQEQVDYIRESATASLLDLSDLCADAHNAHRMRATIADLESKLASVTAERDWMKAALEWIAHFDDEYLKTAATLHWDMNGIAKSALTAHAAGKE